MKRIAVVGLIAFALAGAASAKTAFAALFDANAPIRIDGVVTRIEWGSENLQVHVAGEKLWRLELPGLKGMMMAGLDSAAFGVGDRVSMRGYQAKDKSCVRECIGMTREITFADGLRVLLPPADIDPHADAVHAQRVAARAVMAR